MALGRTTLAQVARERGLMERPTFNDYLLSGEDTLSWADRFYSTLASTGWVRRKPEGSLWLCLPGQYPREMDTSLDDFQGSVHNAIRCVNKNGTHIFLDKDSARVLYRSVYRARLPQLNSIVLEPCLLPGPDGYRI